MIFERSVVNLYGVSSRCDLNGVGVVFDGLKPIAFISRPFRTIFKLFIKEALFLCSVVLTLIMPIIALKGEHMLAMGVAHRNIAIITTR